MPTIHLEAQIDAPIERVFDLARSIDAHQDTMSATAERAIAGVTRGLLGPDQYVTWCARHFGSRQYLTVRMTRFERPLYFQDVMVDGAFKHMRHDHRFEARGSCALMIDDFDFAAPFGIFGRIAEWLLLTRYMHNLLVERNIVLKRVAESDEWKRYLPHT